MQPNGNVSLQSSMRIAFSFLEDKVPDFRRLLQRGFRLNARMGESIREVLCDQFGVSPEYLDKRINTVFLNGKPVDDVDTAMIEEGAILALSAAMPGFVGAALRKGGFYSVMRREITHAAESHADSSLHAFFRLKLFNLVAEEIGPLFLQSGIWLEPAEFDDLIGDAAADFWSGCVKVESDDREVDLGRFLSERPWAKGYDLVHLRVLTAGR